MIAGPIWAVVVRFGRILRRGWRDHEFRGVLYLVSIVIGAGTVFYRFVEDWSWTDAIYFTVITLTTVGYGDLSPTNTPAKMFTVVLVLLGIGVIVAFVERIATLAAEDVAHRRDQRRGQG
jgi:hypothetical protein